MSIYSCKDCGARLDAGERCDCKDKDNNVEDLDRSAQVALITEWLCNMSDKNLKIVKSFVKGIMAREIFEKE